MSKRKKNNQINLKDFILEILKNNKSTMNSRQLAWALNMKGGKHLKKITSSLKKLEHEKLIIQSEKYKFQYNNNKFTTGVIDINKAGNGYVSSKFYKDDIFIEKKNRLNSLNHDTVSIEIIKSKKSGFAGRVQEVISRKQNKFIGRIKKESKNYFFIANNAKIGSDFFIPLEKLNGANHNDLVIIEFIDWPVTAGCPFGSVVKILDDELNLKTYINSLIETLSLRNSFSDDINSELSKIDTTIPEKEITKRRDFRDKLTFTIDPDDAKDFDDAISFNLLPNNNIEIGIHIADVSYYIQQDSAIDKEAFLRAFSIYFPGKVIPMIPEKLSNLVCSLRPNEDKLSFSIVVQFNTQFKMLENLWMGKGIVNSNKRFTYEEVENIINLKDSKKYKEIQILYKISKNLREKRMRSGSIDFNRSDIKCILNNDMEPVKVIEKKTLKAHNLVEEFMLIANKLVANKLSALRQSIYRIHDLPNQESLEELSLYLKHLGENSINLNSRDKNLPNTINNLLKKDDLKANKKILQNLILRSMSKASYSRKNIGHYGLGFKKYTHFTSPIRRYADLLIHRILNAAIYNSKINISELDKQCVHFANVEKSYTDIERKTNKFIQLKLLEKSIGQTFKGLISGLTKWGIYVELEDGAGEGLVAIKELKDDNYYLNEAKKSYVGRKSGKKFQLGQEVSVEIKKINLLKNEMDMVFV
jgi:ribonuclease R